MYIDSYKDEMAHGSFQQDNAAARVHNTTPVHYCVVRSGTE